MSDALIIVESPTKVKTIKKYFGSDYDVRASVGHIKDLPKSKLGIDLENNFEPTYKVIEAKKKVISELKKAAEKAKVIYLAPDPDREGEAIAWHIAELIDGKKKFYRVLFNDLTRNTMLQAIRQPQELDANKYEAQQTRRILDRLVGYQISPILWDKVRRGLSAGRVQSVAVRLICEREEEIRNFVKEEYWTITALLEGKNPPPFEARLVRIAGKKAKILNEAQSRDILRKLDAVPFIVSAIEKKETRKSPPPPFTTSKLQQEAARWFRFSPKKTMRIAQKLYEGIELGKEGPVGLITYMRTDSVRIADEALRDARKFIDDNYGKDYLPPKARFFAKSGRTQDAHEAIRPASLAYRPSDIRKYLGNDEFRLYQLIWNRFVACQMNPAVFDQTTIDITAGSCLFRAQGSVMKFAGFTIVYTEGKDNDDENGIGKTLPEVTEKELLKLLSLTPEQHFTQPPPRFSEATLVKELEEKGIGRPSTYAAILSTIQDREYVRLENGRLFPTELGTLVNEQLVKNFPKILDVEFTAMMENQLDRIEEGTLERLATLKEFYVPFEKDLEKARKQMRNVKKEEIPTDIVCDKCGSPMVIKWGRKGQFIACSNYPKCKNTSNFIEDENGKIVQTETEKTDMVCEKCGKPMVVKEGRFGRFLGCSGYPECKSTAAISLGVSCPEKGCGGDITEKRTKKGKAFFGCSNYPKCKFATWDRPIPEPCPACGAPFLVEKYSRNKGRVKACIDKECGYRQAQE
ncbi:MAG TPA: type I DNA topoisomerase [Syntrophales bacterium]|jgi:DNA topoisomerase-1|nr:type I DNA topoisomerase [Syntrophales bacterium]HRT62764.1 type I DNA topoisomerase [Syntrophales bacterium]